MKRSCTIASATARTSVPLSPTTKIRVLWSVIGKRPSSLALEASRKGIDTASRSRGLPPGVVASINAAVLSCVTSRNKCGLFYLHHPTECAPAWYAQLVPADV
jgi:hypothetical protein